MFIAGIIISCVLGYLLGSINPSILFSRTKGEDIRTKGSGNAGMTNTLRSYGKVAALFVLVADVGKSAVAIGLAVLFAHLTNQTESARLFEIVAAAGAVLGHNYPIYFGFKGGKGVLVSVTAIMMLDWRVGLLALAVFVVIFLISHYVSLGSVLAAVFTPIIAALIARDDIYFIVFTVFAALLIVWRHRSNIVRLYNGTEKKTSLSKKN